MRVLFTILLLCAIWSPASHAGRLSTYIQGTVLKKAKTYWIVQTSQGTYWLRTHRHPSFTRKYSEIESGFWVQTRDIKRFRPLTETASNPVSKPKS